ncbi:MAG: hypothetical protein HGA25_04835, partial [Clostridiales bacterium]|nr:hypothetical protein [Clostridiales bacterium]
KLWNRSKVLTDNEFYEMRYSGKPAEFLRVFRGIYLGVFFNVLVIGVVNLSFIKLAGVMMGVNTTIALIIAAVIILFYTGLGGLKSILWTDFFQFSFAMFGAVITAVYAVKSPEIGSLSGLFSHPLVKDKLNLVPNLSDPTLFLGIFLIPIAVQWWAAWYPGSEPGGGGHVVQRILSAKSEKHSTGATLFFNFFHYAIRPWPWIIVGLASLIIYPDVQSLANAFPGIKAQYVQHDLAYSAIMQKVLPAGYMGIAVAALIAAYMSTVASLLNLGSSYLVNDVYGRIIKQIASGSLPEAFSMGRHSMTPRKFIFYIEKYFNIGIIKVVCPRIYLLITHGGLINMGNVKRIYVEKKEPFAVKAKELHEDVTSFLGITSITKIRIFIRYDVENLSEKTFEAACNTVFSEPPVDILFHETIEIPDQARVFSVEFLPGQFDQRADSAVQCVRFLKEDEEPIIKTAVTYLLEGKISDEEFEKIKSYCINPVDSRQTDMVKPQTLVTEFEEPKDVIIFSGFCQMQEAELFELYQSLGLAMTFKDFLHIHNYFKTEEKTDPSMTEIRVLDTYWSDHCRHTTFSTELKEVRFEEGFYKKPIEKTYENYLAARDEIFKGRSDKFVCLMDLALMAMRKLKKEGKLQDLEESEEINACSIVVPVEIDLGNGPVTEEWLVSFKNETHNHPTEIEPFGGAATCLGGAIRDPLSGRSYVYQAMRVTGAADPTVPVEETLKGKLSQKKLVRGAASGYSSYGNQIGLATGFVNEIYHPDYVAKRMEIGAVMGAAPRR